MLNRRRIRYANDTAYTGVAAQPPPNTPQANLSARAAARTIGKAKSPPALALAPAPLLSQPRQVAPKLLNGLLLGRRTSVTLGDPRFKGFTLGPAQLDVPSDTTLVYDVDDDDEVWSQNRELMKDLSLSAAPAPAPVKMVKRYIPTTTGVKVVEVPESLLKLQIERSNSIRANMNLLRLNLIQGAPRKPSLRALSLTSLSYVNYKVTRSPSMLNTKLPQRQPLKAGAPAGARPGANAAKRQLAPVPPPHTTTTTTPNRTSAPARKAGAATTTTTTTTTAGRTLKKGALQVAPTPSPRAVEEPTTPTPTVSDSERKLAQIRQQVEHEKELQRQIEAAQREYDQLKLQRLHREEVLELFLEEDEEDDEAAATTTAAAAVVAPRAPELSQADVTFDYDTTVPDSPEEEIITETRHVEVIPAPQVIPVPAAANVPSIDVFPEPSVDHDDHPEVVSEESLRETAHAPEPEGLAKLLRPAFAQQPLQTLLTLLVTIPGTPAEVDDIRQLGVPGATGAATGGSLRLLLRLVDLGEPRKPMKLALKNLNSLYTLGSQALGPRALAAQLAYLSLETAENTRLNMKLSQSDLSDGLDPHRLQERLPSRSPQPPLAAERRQLTTLRQQDPHTAHLQQQQGQPGQRHRPQSYAAPQQTKMSNRSLRQLTHGMPSHQQQQQQQAYVAPIAPHPALQPGYQLPLKIKAQQLYAKAQARPMSQFAPVRKSLYLKELRDLGEQGGSATLRGNPSNGQAQQQQPHPTYQANGAGGAPGPQPSAAPAAVNAQDQRASKRLTLRGNNNGGGAAPATQTDVSALSLAGGFRLRIVDSDDEDGPVPFTSGLAGAPAAAAAAQPLALLAPAQQGPPPKKRGGFITNAFILPSVRDQAEAPVEELVLNVNFGLLRPQDDGRRQLTGDSQSLARDKKKFSGKLRKLFGKNKG